MGDTICQMGSCMPVEEQQLRASQMQSHEQLKEQLLAAAGFTGSLTASQQALAGRLAALQLAVKHQRLQQQQQAVGGAGSPKAGLSGHLDTAGAIGSAADVGDGGDGAAAAEDGVELCWPTLCSDICMMGDVAASNE